MATVFAWNILTPSLSMAATTDATLSLNPATVSTTVGGANVSLTARVNPGSNTVEGVNAVQLDVVFNPEVVHLVSVSAVAPFLVAATLDIAASNLTGTLSVPLFIGGSQVTSLADVATLVFSPQGTGNNSPISFAATADAAINDGSGTLVVSTRTGATVTVTPSQSDAVAPVVSSFTLPSTATSLTVPVTAFAATDNVAVAGYKLTETANAPGVGDAGWSATAPIEYIFATQGVKTLYAWAKDAAGNVSTSLNDAVNINLSDTTPPAISQITPVLTPTADTTPSYTFTTNEAGAITYGGSCSSSAAAAIVGNNIITFNALVAGTYSDCTIRVTDAANNASNIINVNTFTVTATVDDPVASPEGGTYDSPQSVTLTSSTPGAAIYYTADGTTPTASSTVYTTPINISANATLKFFAAKAGMEDSQEMMEEYTINNADQVVAPIASLPGGVYIGAHSVTLSTTTSGAIIYYTTDNTTPTLASATYTMPITISQNMTLRAIAAKTGMHNSGVTTEIYAITNGTVVNALNPTQIQNDYEDGIISTDGTPANASKATFNVEYSVQIEDITVTIPQDTEMTRVDGQNFDLTTMLAQQFTMDGMAGVIKFGIPNQRLSFSKAVTISIQVGAAYDGKTMDVFYQNDNETTWNPETTCVVAGGICQFTTTHATYFAAKEKNTSSSKKSSKKKVVKSKRAIKNSKARLQIGDTLYEYGRRFSKSSDVALYFGKYGGGYYAPVIMKTSKDGSFIITYKIPQNKPKGTYDWYAVDLKTGKKSKVVYFKVR